MFDRYTKFNKFNNIIESRSFDPYNRDNVLQAKADALTAYNVHNPLQQRMRDLQRFYASKESSENNLVGG